jgi:HK97 family phage major capsid protein
VTVTATGAGVSVANLMTAIERLWRANFEPTGIIWSPDVQADLERLQDTQNNPLTLPPTLAKLPKFKTNQVPVSGGASTIFIADWSRLLIGMRTQLTIEATREAGDSAGSAFTNLQVWVRGYARLDVALERGGAFDESTVTT